jgi:hypothetical protein
VPYHVGWTFVGASMSNATQQQHRLLQTSHPELLAYPILIRNLLALTCLAPFQVVNHIAAVDGFAQSHPQSGDSAQRDAIQEEMAFNGKSLCIPYLVAVSLLL